MNLDFISVDPENPDSMQEFVDLNAIEHETIFNTLLGVNGITIEHYPLWTNGQPDRDWLLVHDRVHKAECAALSLPVPPDLDSANFDDPQQSADWFNNHALLHDLEAQALGI